MFDNPFPLQKNSPTYLDCLHPGGSVPRQGEAVASFISVYYQCPALFSQLELYKDKQQFRREEIGWCQHLVFFRWGLLLTSEMCISIFEPGYGAPHLLSITRHAASPCLASQGESSIPSPPRFTLKIVQKCFRYWITPKIKEGPDWGWLFCMVRVFKSPIWRSPSSICVNFCEDHMVEPKCIIQDTDCWGVWTKVHISL